MGRYPRTARNAQMKCIKCNAPVVETVDGTYACVDCGGTPIAARKSSVEDVNGTTTRSRSSASDD